MPNENFPCQTLSKNAKFVKSGLEKCQLAALLLREAYVKFRQISVILGTCKLQSSDTGSRQFSDRYFLDSKIFCKSNRLNKGEKEEKHQLTLANTIVPLKY